MRDMAEIGKHPSAFLLLLIVLSCISPACFGSDSASGELPSPRFQSFIDWKNGTVVIEAVITLQEPIQAKTRYAAERRIEEEIAEAFLQEMWDLPVDSVRLLGDILSSNPETLAAVRELSSRGVKEKAGYSRDMRSVQVKYAFPLFGIGGLADLLIQHREPFPVPRVLGFVPTRNYSGIVLYARGSTSSSASSSSGL